MRKNQNSGCFNSRGKCLHGWLMHEGKDNIMLFEWCHKHSLGGGEKSAFMIGSDNWKYDWLPMRRAV